MEPLLWALTCSLGAVGRSPVLEEHLSLLSSLQLEKISFGLERNLSPFMIL